MALTTTIYDSLNACTIGSYHTYKGEVINVEFIGTGAECLDMVDTLVQSEDDNEVVHVIVRPNVRTLTPDGYKSHAVTHTNLLFNAWSMPVGVTV